MRTRNPIPYHLRDPKHYRCECGQVAFARRDGDWICQRCLELENKSADKHKTVGTSEDDCGYSPTFLRAVEIALARFEREHFLPAERTTFKHYGVRL